MLRAHFFLVIVSREGFVEGRGVATNDPCTERTRTAVAVSPEDAGW
jgi:hypothetical protein